MNHTDLKIFFSDLKLLLLLFLVACCLFGTAARHHTHDKNQRQKNASDFQNLFLHEPSSFCPASQPWTPKLRLRALNDNRIISKALVHCKIHLPFQNPGKTKQESRLTEERTGQALHKKKIRQKRLS